MGPGDDMLHLFLAVQLLFRSVRTPCAAFRGEGTVILGDGSISHQELRGESPASLLGPQSSSLPAL